MGAYAAGLASQGMGQHHHETWAGALARHRAATLCPAASAPCPQSLDLEAAPRAAVWRETRWIMDTVCESLAAWQASTRSHSGCVGGFQRVTLNLDLESWTASEPRVQQCRSNTNNAHWHRDGRRGSPSASCLAWTFTERRVTVYGHCYCSTKSWHSMPGLRVPGQGRLWHCVNTVPSDTHWQA